MFSVLRSWRALVRAFSINSSSALNVTFFMIPVYTSLVYSRKSELLFRRLRSTVPGLGEIWDGGARKHRRVHGEFAGLRQIPDLPEDFPSALVAPLLALDQLLHRGA